MTYIYKHGSVQENRQAVGSITRHHSLYTIKDSMGKTQYTIDRDRDCHFVIKGNGKSGSATMTLHAFHEALAPERAEKLHLSLGDEDIDLFQLDDREVVIKERTEEIARVSELHGETLTMTTSSTLPAENAELLILFSTLMEEEDDIAVV